MKEVPEILETLGFRPLGWGNINMCAIFWWSSIIFARLVGSLCDFHGHSKSNLIKFVLLVIFTNTEKTIQFQLCNKYFIRKKLFVSTKNSNQGFFIQDFTSGGVSKNQGVPLPLPSFSLPSPPFRSPFPSLSLEVGPLNSARGLGERCKLPALSGTEPQPKLNLVHFSL